MRRSDARRRDAERRRAAFALSLGLLVAATLMASIAAAAACGRRADVVTMLRQRHGEWPVAMAMTDDGRVLELWAHEAGPWTLLVTSPEGISCVQATGSETWEDLPRGEPA